MASTELEQKIEEEFGEFGFDIAGNLTVIEKLSDLCVSHNIDCETLLAKWISFSNENNDVQISENTLIEFEKKKVTHVSSKVNRKLSTPHRGNTCNVNTIRSIDSFAIDGGNEDEDDMLGSYVTTPQAQIKRLKQTPDEKHNKRFAGSTPISDSFSNRSRIVSSPAAYSPGSISIMMTPSAKYESRESRGNVVLSYGVEVQTGMDWEENGANVSIQDFNNDCNVSKPYKHMFQKLQDKADVLNEMIIALSKQMKNSFSLKEFESVATTSQEEITVVGRICCDSVGKINSKSVVIEGCKEISDGQRIALDLTDVKNYSFFPGQIVAIQGRNLSGSKIYPTTIYTGTRLPFYSPNKKDETINDSHFTMYISCGPYATCDEDLSYTPLDDLIRVVEKEKPDVLIMLGPFVDCKQSLIETGDINSTYEDLFIHCKIKVNDCIRKLPTKAVFIPSQRDIFHHFVYPQPPLPADLFVQGKPIKADIKMFPDPCTLKINDVSVGVTSTDVLFHLGSEEVSSVRSDRLGRLAGHLLQQQCYYPIHPTSENVNLDYEKFEYHAFMPVTPDILILPSDLRYFVKNVDGCLCVNPGRLVKGQNGGGTFVKLLVKPKKQTNASKSSVVDESIAQIVRI